MEIHALVPFSSHAVSSKCRGAEKAKETTEYRNGGTSSETEEF
jgi:hypothetical protein